MAWVDTAGRAPLVRRRDGAFEIEYAAGHLLERDLSRLPEGSPRRVEVAAKRFEKFGFHRALRLAGARAGDRVRVGELELTLWEYPTPRLRASAGGDGIADYGFAVIPALGRLDEQELAPIAEGVADEVIASLLEA